MNPSVPVKRKTGLVKGFGPAMSACSPMQRKFIQASFDHPELTPESWLMAAGYRGSYHATRKMILRLLHNPLVQDAMVEVGSSVYRSKLPKVINAIDKIISDPTARDHVKVLHGVLDRVGMHPVAESRTTVTHTFDRDAIIARIASVLEKHPEALLTVSAPALPEPLKSGDTLVEPSPIGGEQSNSE